VEASTVRPQGFKAPYKKGARGGHYGFGTNGQKHLVILCANRMANRLAKQYGLKLGAKRFVAGTSIDAALQASRELNAHGMTAH